MTFLSLALVKIHLSYNMHIDLHQIFVSNVLQVAINRFIF